MRREVVRGEPRSNDRETWKAPAVVTRTEDQTEIVLRTETGAGTTVTLIDGRRPADRIEPARADGVARWLGLAPAASGLVGWDVFDAVLSPGDVILPMSWRWELRGDGISVPYRWVWIPSPPTTPPAPPDGGTPTPAPSGRPEPPGNTRVYRWTDAAGTLHLTDRLDQVPERYRAPARAAKPS